jgi:hypothetical protein
VGFPVIPAKAGIQLFQILKNSLDSGFHRSDDFLRDHQYWNFGIMEYWENGIVRKKYHLLYPLFQFSFPFFFFSATSVVPFPAWNPLT